jgi:hypothetical protein
MLMPLLFQQTGILMGDALLGAEQEEIGFAWALSIRHHDVRRNHRRHENPLHGSAVLTPLDVGAAMTAG